MAIASSQPRATCVYVTDAPGRRYTLCSHMTQPLELGVHAPPKASQACVDTLCKSFGGTDHMCSAALSEPCPRLIDSITITDQHTSLVLNKLRKGNFGTVRVYVKVGHCWVCH